MNELYHYGVKGQKWGIRRYQNKDGSLTAAGKQRVKGDSLDRKFKAAERDIKNKLSNKCSAFNKQKIDIASVKARSGLDDVDVIRCSALATKKFNEASKVEPKITKDIKGVGREVH